MQPQSLTPQDATGLLSLIGLVVLFIGLLFLIRRTQLKRLKQPQASPSSRSETLPTDLQLYPATPFFQTSGAL